MTQEEPKRRGRRTCEMKAILDALTGRKGSVTVSISQCSSRTERVSHSQSKRRMSKAEEARCGDERESFRTQ